MAGASMERPSQIWVMTQEGCIFGALAQLSGSLALEEVSPEVTAA